VWGPLLEPGLNLLIGKRHELRAFHQELVHHAVHHAPGVVLWLDGDHGCNPYDFAELNLTRGRQADDGADRVLLKRCMTPFQWDSAISRHLDDRLLDEDASLVLVAPFDRPVSTDELKDWEQEDYVRYFLRHLKNIGRRHQIPVAISVDLARWWHTHPALAALTVEAATAKWKIRRQADSWRAEGPSVIETPRRTLLDYLPREDVVSPLLASTPRKSAR